MRNIFKRMKYLFSLIIGLSFFIQIGYSQASFSQKGSPCIGTPIVFYDDSSIPASAWMWDFGNGDTSSDADSVRYVYTEAGEYKVSLTINSGGNNYTVSEDVTIHENPDCSFTVDSVAFSSYSRIFTDESLSNNPFSSFRWSFGNGQTVVKDSSIAEYKYSSAGDYEVWLWSTDNVGCTDSASQTVTVSNIYRVPNVFTPNADGVNDQFIATVNGVEYFSIEIYSRWGNLVFKRESVNHLIWDGRMPDGSKVKPGTYFYVITAHDSQNVYDPESGFITVFYEKDE